MKLISKTLVIAVLLITSVEAMCDIDPLISVLISKESGGNDRAIGKAREVGCLQIRTCVVDDVNTFFRKNYKYIDRTNRAKSIEIAKLYLEYWVGQYERKTGCTATYEVVSRIWNGGPNGWCKSSTMEYWADVKNRLTEVARNGKGEQAGT